jgi:hypothetical protein
MNHHILENIKNIKVIRRFTTISRWCIVWWKSLAWSENITRIFWFDDIKYKNSQNSLFQIMNNNSYSGWWFSPLIYRAQNKCLEKIYYVCFDFCTCPDYKYRRKKRKEKCKHQLRFEYEQQVYKISENLVGNKHIGELILDFTG